MRPLGENRLSPRRRNLHWSWCRGPLGESRHLDGEVEGAVALLGFGGVCSGLDLGLNPSNKRVRNRFGARENDLAARERNLAGGSRRGAGGRRAAHRIASWGRSTLSSPAAGWKRALGPRVCPFSRADRGAPVPFSLSFLSLPAKIFVTYPYIQPAYAYVAP